MFESRSIYLDHSATTPTDPRVVEAMLPYFADVYGNPSSSHSFGRRAQGAVESARMAIAKILNTTRGQIIFTGCGTESDNMVLRGFAWHDDQRPCHIFTAQTEHHAISHTAEQVAALGRDVRLTWLPVDHEGVISPENLALALQGASPDARILVSIMYANNEVGTIQPIQALAEVTHRYGGLFHTDAVQAAGQLSLDVEALGVDMLSLSAHKFYGPKGVGLLYAKNGTPLAAAQTDGGQEGARRAGTHNVPLIVGMAKALELAYMDLGAHVHHYQTLRDMLIDGVLARIPDAQLTGAGKNQRMPSHASFVFAGVEANMLLMHLDMAGISASSGSACNTGNPKPSDALTAMGYPAEVASTSLRLSVGRQNTEADIAYVLDVLTEAVAKIRTIYAMQN
jgi:cysteine desulfurase